MYFILASEKLISSGELKKIDLNYREEKPNFAVYIPALYVTDASAKEPYLVADILLTHEKDTAFTFPTNNRELMISSLTLNNSTFIHEKAGVQILNLPESYDDWFLDLFTGYPNVPGREKWISVMRSKFPYVNLRKNKPIHVKIEFNRR